MDELDLAQLSANNRQSCRAPVPSWRKNRASSWMPICRRCAAQNKTASASGRRKRRWRVPNCWRRTVKTCRRTSPPSLRSTVSSPGAEPAGAAHGSGGVPAAAGDESNAAGAQALNTLREQSQWLGSSNLLGEALRASGAAAGAPSPAAAGYGNGAAARAASAL